MNISTLSDIRRDLGCKINLFGKDAPPAVCTAVKISLPDHVEWLLEWFVNGELHEKWMTKERIDALKGSEE